MKLSDAGKAFRRQVIAEIIQQRSGLPAAALRGRLAVTITCFPPDRRRRDVDNWAKAMLDAIEKSGLVFLDDSQIDDLHIKRGERCPNGGRSIVTVREL